MELYKTTEGVEGRKIQDLRRNRVKRAIYEGEAVCALEFKITQASTGPKLQDIHKNSIGKTAWQQETNCTPFEPPVKELGNDSGSHKVLPDPAGRPGCASEDRGSNGTTSSLVMDSSRNVSYAEDETKKITSGRDSTKSKLQLLIESIGKGPGVAAT